MAQLPINNVFLLLTNIADSMSGPHMPAQWRLPENPISIAEKITVVSNLQQH